MPDSSVTDSQGSQPPTAAESLPPLPVAPDFTWKLPRKVAAACQDCWTDGRQCLGAVYSTPMFFNFISPALHKTYVLPFPMSCKGFLPTAVFLLVPVQWQQCCGPRSFSLQGQPGRWMLSVSRAFATGQQSPEAGSRLCHCPVAIAGLGMSCRASCSLLGSTQ